MVNSVNLLSHAILKYLLSVWLLFNDGFEVANTAQYTVHFKICYKNNKKFGVHSHLSRNVLCSDGFTGA